MDPSEGPRHQEASPASPYRGTACAVCQSLLEDNDSVMLVARRGERRTELVPIHVRCVDARTAEPGAPS
jgi:hypothetical protein